MSVLAIDAGTTGVKAVIVNPDGQIVSRGYAEFPQHFPEPGWVEHEPDDIWHATLTATETAVRNSPVAPTAIGITNQRETAVCWNRSTLQSPRRAIVWQDRRTADICRRLQEAGHEARVNEVTGLRLDPYFTGTKLTWIRENDAATWSLIERGEVVVGTVDSYLIARLTGGVVHATDPSNASRTLLFDLAGGWSQEMCDLFGVPVDALPEVRPSAGVLGETHPDALLGLTLPIAGVAGDQQAALFGQACYDVGASKCTYGTGSFVLVNTGSRAVRSSAGLLTTVAWDIGDGLVYALEGAIFVTGAAVQWLRDGLGLIASADEIEALASSVADSGSVVFVPALTGLGAPYWDPAARGVIVGITRGTTAAHLARATLEAIAFEVRDVVETLDLTELSVDGGAAVNDLLCQIQATQLQVPVRRPQSLETTSLGAAFLAGLATGVWRDTDELRATWRLDRKFEPAERDETGYTNWKRAVERSQHWV